MRKGKDPDIDPYLWRMDPDPGGPKTCGTGSGSPTLVSTHSLTVHFKVTFAVPAQPAAERPPWPARARGPSSTAAEKSRKNSSTAEKSRKTSPAAADFRGQRSPDGGCRGGAKQRRSGGGVPEVQEENGSAHPEREGETPAIRVQDQAAHSPRGWYVNTWAHYTSGIRQQGICNICLQECNIIHATNFVAYRLSYLFYCIQFS